ncbi:MAG: hypothetical protein JOY71_02535 [Acetobacteraceae bacterium]|nr:hypothetical protein [Acetobacteraceae bacterium]MBV8521002.1 hypothetical protein [Acetobacteraceae bacterium]
MAALANELDAGSDGLHARLRCRPAGAEGALVEAIEPEGLEIRVPPPVQQAIAGAFLLVLDVVTGCARRITDKRSG